MKILICTNFAQPFHMGGAEKVVQQIAESMVHDFGCDCTVITQHGKGKIIHNGVQVLPLGNVPENLFIDILCKEKANHILIYSDWFFRFPTILQHIEKFNCKFTLIPVGFNRMRSHHVANKSLSIKFREKQNHFSIVVHSDFYADAIYCQQNKYPYKIIPNGIDLSEFTQNDNNFKNKYKIPDKKILLCVSNFFPGKGQEFLLPVVSNLVKKRNDFTLLFESTTLAFMIGNKRREDLQQKVTNLGLPIMFLNDLPRKDIVESFFASDIFVFPSQQEVSPLVLLESMAASMPWISMNVGNAEDLQGGFCFKSRTNQDNMLLFDDEICNQFTDTINALLDNQDMCKNLGKIGRNCILDKYNWDQIKHQYKEQFYA